MGRVVDKSKWPRGEWDDEPDEVRWSYRGVDCLVLRPTAMGHLCGYVRIPEDHPCMQWGEYLWDAPDSVAVEVHGGVTFGPRPFEGRADLPGVWVGFDCNHHLDYAPGSDASLREIGLRCEGGYRNLNYVKRETERLAVQLTALAFAQVEGGAA